MEPGNQGRTDQDRGDSQPSPGSIVTADHSRCCRGKAEHAINIESLALPGENPAELRALLDQWYAAYQPGSPAECHLVDMAVYDLIQIRRSRRYQESVEEQVIKDTKNRWSMEQEALVKKLRERLAHEPAAALAELKRFASGCAWLIGCWQRLEALIEREVASSVDNREELAAFEANGAHHEALSRDETDHLTRVYCLLAQGDTKEHAILAFYLAESCFPSGGPLPSSGSLPPRWQCRRRVRAVIGRELAPLRVLYEKGRVEYDLPALEEAVKEALRRDPKRSTVLRSRRQTEKWFHANYKLLLEMRKNFTPPSALPGGPIAASPRKRSASAKRTRAGG
jgi:hypothetical protein